MHIAGKFSYRFRLDPLRINILQSVIGYKLTRYKLKQCATMHRVKINLFYPLLGYELLPFMRLPGVFNFPVPLVTNVPFRAKPLAYNSIGLFMDSSTF